MLIIILFISGNGVDISLGYPTSLNNCNDWVHSIEIQNSCLKTEIQNVDRHYYKLFRGNLWSDVEANIPKIDKPPKGISDEEWYGTDIWGDIKNVVQDWVVHICHYVNNHDVHPTNLSEYQLLKKIINKSDLILDFNYTPTFEKHFNIPSIRVIHIHGNDVYPILGHGGKEIINGSRGKMYYAFYNGTLKGTNSQFSKFQNRFKDIHISELIFMGVSYSRVDWDYYKYLKIDTNSIIPNCKAIFYYHSRNDRQKVKTFCKYLQKLGIIRNRYQFKSVS